MGQNLETAPAGRTGHAGAVSAPSMMYSSASVLGCLGGVSSHEHRVLIPCEFPTKLQAEAETSGEKGLLVAISLCKTCTGRLREL